MSSCCWLSYSQHEKGQPGGEANTENNIVIYREKWSLSPHLSKSKICLHSGLPSICVLQSHCLLFKVVESGFCYVRLKVPT